MNSDMEVSSFSVQVSTLAERGTSILSHGLLEFSIASVSATHVFSYTDTYWRMITGITLYMLDKIFQVPISSACTRSN